MKHNPIVTLCNINIFVTELNIYFYIFSLDKNKPRKRGLFESLSLFLRVLNRINQGRLSGSRTGTLRFSGKGHRLLDIAILD